MILPAGEAKVHPEYHLFCSNNHQTMELHLYYFEKTLQSIAESQGPGQSPSGGCAAWMCERAPPFREADFLLFAAMPLMSGVAAKTKGNDAQ
jgi:hypothetical protein